MRTELSVGQFAAIWSLCIIAIALEGSCSCAKTVDIEKGTSTGKSDMSIISSPQTVNTDMLVPNLARDYYQLNYGIPSHIYKQLEYWGALPKWAQSKEAEKTLRDWLDDFKSKIIGQNIWPKEFEIFDLQIIEGRLVHADSMACNSKPLIAVSSSLPAELEVLFKILNHPIQYDNKLNERFREPKKMVEAASRLQALIGMLDDTGYIDNRDPLLLNDVTKFGAYFIFAHELGHMYFCKKARPDFSPEKGVHNKLDRLLTPSLKEKLFDELAADQFAFATLVLFFRGRPGKETNALAGIVSAMILSASLEYTKNRSIKSEEKRLLALTRMKTMLLNVEKVIKWNSYLTYENIKDAQLYVNIWFELLRNLEIIPSPLTQLLFSTAIRPKEDWIEARNLIAIWRFFGINSHNKMLPILRDIYRNTEHDINSGNYPNASRIREFIDYLQKETKEMEPDFGLKSALDDSGHQ